jgi:hypothetical protein
MSSFVSRRRDRELRKQVRTADKVAASVLALLCFGIGSPSLFAQTSDRSTAPIGVSFAEAVLRPPEGGHTQRLLLSGERAKASELLPQRAASRDSLRNGALIGAAIGAAALGTLAATLCHVHRERGGPSCVFDALRFTAIGGAIGLAAGIAIDVARSSSPMVRLSVAF